MIEKFENYLKKNLVKKKHPNKEEAKALIKKALMRLKFLEVQKINNINSTFIFENAYEAIREAAQALMSLKGYKPYSHEAIISFLQEFYHFSPHLLDTFNRYRILRNKAVYAAVKISTIVCQETLKFAKEFIHKINEIVKREIEE